MITSESSVAHAPPGRYQLRTILYPMVRAHRTTKEHRKEYKRKWALARRARIRKAATIQILESIHMLPDDEHELWIRPDV